MSDQLPGELAAYSLAWAEEFDGPAGAPASPRSWRPETGGHGWGNAELQYYTAEPASAALDGELRHQPGRSPRHSARSRIFRRRRHHRIPRRRLPARRRLPRVRGLLGTGQNPLVHRPDPLPHRDPSRPAGPPRVFDHDFYLLINVAIGGHPSAAPDASTAFPQAMLVDYIRLYTAA